MMKILVTGFDPFGGEKINPAFEAVKLLPETIDGHEIIKLEIPTVFNKSIDTVVKKINEVNPDIVLAIGQAGGRFEVTPERIAINVDDARIPDNEGNQPLNQAIYKDGETAYFSTLPVKAMVEAIKEAGVPSSLSNTAGTFVCNHVMYGILYHIATIPEFAGKKGGFIHVPFMTEQIVGRVNTPSLSLEQITKGLNAAITACIKNNDDVEVVAGKID